MVGRRRNRSRSADDRLRTVHGKPRWNTRTWRTPSTWRSLRENKRILQRGFHGRRRGPRPHRGPDRPARAVGAPDQLAESL